MIKVYFFERYGEHRDLHVLTHSFPTRRSSDLLADRCRDHLGCERRILIGHMAVSLEARDVAIFRVDQTHRLALLGSKEELPVAGCRLPLSPEGGHGQGGVGLHDHGERPIIGAARSEEHTSELQSLMRIS